MQISFDRSHVLWGIGGTLFGLYLCGVMWWASSMYKKDELRQQLISLAQCNDLGFINVTFPGGGEFTCTPTQNLPPTKPRK